MNTVQPVILCGGSGTRLYPLSTKAIPKQFISLGSKGTLLEETINRLDDVMSRCEETNYKTHDPILIMHKDHKLPIELSLHGKNVVYEDYANDTGVAVAKAALEIKRRYPTDKIIMVVLPADHYIMNNEAFIRDIADGIDKVTDNNIVLYGIDPVAPETKYGYIIPSAEGIKFQEKPDLQTAIDLISNNALWNSGIFSASVDLVIDSLNKSTHNIMNWISNPRSGKAASFDVAVLQEHKNIRAIHCKEWNWSDVGTWESFTDIPEVKQEMQNATNVIKTDCEDVNVLNRGPGNIVVIGCHDILVVSSGRDILIMPRKGDYNNKLKEIATKINL